MAAAAVLTDAATRGALQRGFEDLMKVYAAALCAPLVGGAVVPAGFSGRFADAMAKPALEKLFGFLVWLAPQVTAPEVASVQRHIMEAERGGRGWLGRMVSLRDLWTPPAGGPPEETVAEALDLWRAAPSFLRQEGVDVAIGAEAFWSEGGRRIGLAPFAWGAGRRLVVFSEFRPPDRLEFELPNPQMQDRFAAVWAQLRARDGAPV